MSRLGFSGRLLFWFAVVCCVAYVSETRGSRSRGGFRSGSRYRSSRRVSVDIEIGSNRGHYYYDHHRGGEGTSTAGMISGIVVAVIVLIIFILVLSCIYCRCRACHCKHCSSDEDDNISAYNHAISRYKASRDNNPDVTKPLSYDSAANDYRAGYSDSESTDSLPYSAKDPGYSSTRYPTGTSNGLPYPRKSSGNPAPAYSVYPSAGYSSGTSSGLPYSSNRAVRHAIESSDYPVTHAIKSHEIALRQVCGPVSCDSLVALSIRTCSNSSDPVVGQSQGRANQSAPWRPSPRDVK